MELILIILILIIYFLPTIIGHKRWHKNLKGIFLTNLFFGWAVIGWLVALIWSVSDNITLPELREKTPKDFRDSWKIEE
jgi:hypothetical protein